MIPNSSYLIVPKSRLERHFRAEFIGQNGERFAFRPIRFDGRQFKNGCKILHLTKKDFENYTIIEK